MSRGTNFRSPFAVNVTRDSFFFRTRIKKQRDQERQRAFDDRHWSKKSLEEMVERDWRILREDFAISTKGKRFLDRLLKSCRVWSWPWFICVFYFFVCGLLCVLLDTNIVAVLIVISVATEEKQQLRSYYPRNELIATNYS